VDRVRLKRETTAEMVFANPRIGGWLILPAAYAMVWFAQSRIDEPAGLWAITVAGMIFGTSALLGVLWRFDVTFDLPGRCYSGKKGFWPGARALKGSLSELEGVALEPVRRRTSRAGGGSDETDAWSVRLLFREWDQPLSVFETRSESAAYARLDHYARKLKVPAIDRTGPREVRRDPAELDRRIAARGERSDGAATPIGQPPARSAIVWNSGGEHDEILLPPLGLGFGTAFLGLLGLAFAGFGAMPLLALTGTIEVTYHGSHAAGWTLGVLFVLIGLSLTIGGVVFSRSRQVIRERRDGLCFSREFLGHSWRHCFVLRRAVQEIAVHRSSQTRAGRTEVVLRSDDEIIGLAGHLTSEEQEWLTRALQTFICR